MKDSNDQVKCVPIKSRIVSLLTEGNDLLYAVPGGLIGVGLMVDPSMTRNDKMVGNVLGRVGHLPDIFTEIDIKFYMMRTLIGMKNDGENRTTKIKKLAEGEVLKFNIGSTETPGKIIKVTDVIVSLIRRILSRYS